MGTIQGVLEIKLEKEDWGKNQATPDLNLIRMTQKLKSTIPFITIPVDIRLLVR